MSLAIFYDNYYTALKKENTEEAKRIIDVLVSIGVNLDKMVPAHPTTLLTLAVIYNSFEIVNYLIQKGADINAQDMIDTPISVAIRKKNKNMLLHLIELGADINAIFRRNGIGYIPVILAILSENFDMLKILVEAGANINNTKFPLPLAITIYRKEKDIVYYLLEQGADPNSVPKIRSDEIFAYPPLWIAIYLKDFALTKKLIETGADTNLLFRNRNSAAFCVIHGTPEILRLLCENNANVNQIDPLTGDTPLILALLRKQISLDMIRILCEFGADKRIKNRENQSAFSLAQEIQDEGMMYEVFSILKYCGITDPKGVNQTEKSEETLNEPGAIQKNESDLNFDLEKAIEKQDLSLIKRIINLGADVSVNDYDALALAASTGNIDIFKYLLKLSRLFLNKKDSRNDLLEKFFKAAGNKVHMFQYIQRRSENNAKNVMFNITQYHIIKQNNNTLSSIFAEHIPLFDPDQLTALLTVAYAAQNKEAFQKLLDVVNLQRLTDEQKVGIGKLVKDFAVKGDLRMLKRFKQKGFDFSYIADDLWNIVYHRWIDIEKFLEELGFVKPWNLNTKILINNVPEGGKRRTRKIKPTRQKLNNRSK